MTFKIGDVLVVRPLADIQAEGGNTYGMVEGDELTVTRVQYDFNDEQCLIDVGDIDYGVFSIEPSPVLSWKTFFTRKENV